ncbi:MAG: hypothetical protein ACJAV1_000394 [Paraglaciecola sp.]|jgi:hypothetical protein
MANLYASKPMKIQLSTLQHDSNFGCEVSNLSLSINRI